MSAPITPEALTALADELDGLAAAIEGAHAAEPGVPPIAQSLGRASGYRHAASLLRRDFNLPARAGAKIHDLTKEG